MTRNVYKGDNRNNGYHNERGLDEFRGRGGNDLAIWYGNNGDNFIFRGGRGRDFLLIDDIFVEDRPEISKHGDWTWIDFGDDVIKTKNVEQIVIHYITEDSSRHRGLFLMEDYFRMFDVDDFYF